MWRNPEEPVDAGEPAGWTQAIQAAFSGLLICMLILVAFAAAGSPTHF
jgi:hypothetical protein